MKKYMDLFCGTKQNTVQKQFLMVRSIWVINMVSGAGGISLLMLAGTKRKTPS